MNANTNTSPRNTDATVTHRTTPEPTPVKAPAKRKPTSKAKTTKAAKPAPKATPATKTPANCGCGCGVPTVTAKALFLSGHDARLAGVLGKARATGTATPAQQEQYANLSDKLQAKVDGVVSTHQARAAKKVAASKAREVAKKAYAKALADALA